MVAPKFTFKSSVKPTVSSFASRAFGPKPAHQPSAAARDCCLDPVLVGITPLHQRLELRNFS
jgi:hypothetical protein